MLKSLFRYSKRRPKKCKSGKLQLYKILYNKAKRYIFPSKKEGLPGLKNSTGSSNGFKKRGFNLGKLVEYLS